ncbi:MAG: hypothetical protein ACT4PT_02305 [Methanobacteriota archaeon]
MLAGAILVPAFLFVVPAGADAPLEFEEFTIDPAAMCGIQARWQAAVAATYPPGEPVPLRVELSDVDLAAMGLPSRAFLLSHRFPEPTLVTPDGATQTVDLSPLMQTLGTLGPTVASFAGTGCVGIRPGAFLLLISGGSIGWCSMAHVYGSPGAYQISTAGHCGKVGEWGTVIAAFGNRAGATNPILLDFGKFVKSVDQGVGKDWALINVDAPWQGLVSPTLCAWGGPRGAYTRVGTLVGITFPRNQLIPKITVNPDPTLVTSIVHYGHGLGVGAGGTPRTGTVLDWGAAAITWVGEIQGGDSGSASNAVNGDTVGAVNEAAGINTHTLAIGGLVGIPLVYSTRVTQVAGTLANGQILPYPVPVPGAP